jgi:hypothetical protein
MEQMSIDFRVVRDYIYESKKTNIDVVAKETGVAKQKIHFLLKEGWLTLDESEVVGMLTCEGCKKPIFTGRFCDECKANYSSAMQKSIEKSEKTKRESESHGIAMLQTKK